MACPFPRAFLVAATGEHDYEADLYRLKGELLLQLQKRGASARQLGLCSSLRTFGYPHCPGGLKITALTSGRE